MKLVWYSSCVSPHQFPIAKELAKLVGGENFRNVYDHPLADFRVRMGWNPSLTELWELVLSEHPDEGKRLLIEADVLICSFKNIDLFKCRSKLNKVTVYCAERWFKPIFRKIGFSGWLRVLDPRYFACLYRFMMMMRNDVNFKCYPMGIHARNELLFLSKVFRVKKAFQRIVTWGYVVSAGKPYLRMRNENIVRVMWAGRLIDWKHCEDLILAMKQVLSKREKGYNIELDIYGEGELLSKMKQLVDNAPEIQFKGSVSNIRIREEMRTHDVYVITSDYNEGWGAVVNEALEEGMTVLGTYEAGASATILPSTHLFHSGDVTRLSELLLDPPPATGIGEWSATGMAKRLIIDLGIDVK